MNYLLIVFYGIKQYFCFLWMHLMRKLLSTDNLYFSRKGEYFVSFLKHRIT